MAQPKKISASEKQKLIEKQIKIAPHLSARAISKQLGYSHVTIQKYKQKLLETGQLSIVDTPPPEYLQHPYFVKNRNLILKKLDARGLRALKAPGVIQLMEERKSLSPRSCQAILNRMKKAERRKNTSDKIPEVDIRCLDLINDDMSWVADSSVDLILTDLPYSSAYINVYKALSHLAGRVLKKDGIASLVCMTGYGALPQVLDALREDTRLRYNWTITTVFPRRSSNLGWIGVSSFAKPVIHMTCEKAYKGEIYSDLITAEPANKARDIPWEQPLDVFQKLASVFIQHGDSVLLDPCCGSGTSLLSALRTKCCAKVIGTDISEDCIRISKKRIMNYLDSKDISE